jgi:hypothetical protein
MVIILFPYAVYAPGNDCRTFSVPAAQSSSFYF